MKVDCSSKFLIDKVCLYLSIIACIHGIYYANYYKTIKNLKEICQQTRRKDKGILLLEESLL